VDIWDEFHTQFEKESDRACVIIAATVLEQLLRDLLVAHLLPVTSSDDALFDIPNAPLATFSSRITVAHRLGLISTRFARDLHLVRKIRNDFAHSIQGCSFDDSRVHARILTLSRSSGIIQRSKEVYPDSDAVPTRDHFLLTASWMIYYLQKFIGRVPGAKCADEEWGYQMTRTPDKKPELVAPDPKPVSEKRLN
jgi:DNA-binding MltR family transcriptional regulator